MISNVDSRKPRIVVEVYPLSVVVTEECPLAAIIECHDLVVSESCRADRCFL